MKTTCTLRKSYPKYALKQAQPPSKQTYPLTPPPKILIWIYNCTHALHLPYYRCIIIYRKTIKIKETDGVSNRVLALSHDLHQHSKRGPPAFFVVVVVFLRFFVLFFFFTNKIFQDFLDIFLRSAGSTPASLIRREIPCTFFMNKTQSRDCLCHSNSTENHTVAHKRSLCRRENIDGGKISLISLKLR